MDRMTEAVSVGHHMVAVIVVLLLILEFNGLGSVLAS